MQFGKPGRTHTAPVLVIALGVALNQSSVVGGFNLSVADLVVVLLLVSLLTTKSLHVPRGPLAVFLLISSLVTLNAAFFIPAIMAVEVPLSSVLGGYLKLWASFAFFVVGTQLSRQGQLRTLARAFYLTSCVVSAIGTLHLAGINLPLTREMVRFGFRFIGLMNDPNYFAVLTVAAMALMYRDTLVPAGLKLALSLVLTAGVISSASKTGMITLILWSTWVLVGLIRRNLTSSALKLIGAGLIASALVGIGATILDSSTTGRFSESSNPALRRIAPLFTDFDSAISEGGSTRNVVWDTSIEVINRLPILGTGPGAYGPVAKSFTGSDLLAHNTFLQLLAEWGIPISIAFWCFVLLTIVRASNMQPSPVTLALRDACLVFLVGSIGISLNNARLFWILLGALSYVAYYKVRPLAHTAQAHIVHGSKL